MKRTSLQWTLGVAAVLLLLSGGCTDRAERTVGPDGNNIELSAKITSPEFTQLIDVFRLTVTARDIEPIVESLFFDGRYIWGEVQVPSGAERRFMLEAIDSDVGAAQPDSENVVYRGATVADVRPEVIVQIDIPMRPVPPMVKFTPRWGSVESGSTFSVDVTALNMPQVRGLWLFLDFPEPIIEPLRTFPAPGLAPSAVFGTGYTGESPVFYMVVLDTAHLPISDADGDVTLGTIQFTTQGFTGGPLAVPILIDTVWAMDTAGNSLPTDGFYTDMATVQILPLTDRIVNFPDVNVETSVLNVLGQQTGPIMLSDVLTIDTLYAYGSVSSIQSLEGMEALHNLVVFNTNEQQLSDISPLAGLYNLTDLTLDYNQISNVYPLADLVRLTRLRMSGNNIVDITALGGMVELFDLDLSYNDIVNIGSLAEMDELYYLNLRSNNITDIDPLIGCRNVVELWLDYNSNLVDISALAELPYLRILRLSYTSVSNLQPLWTITVWVTATISTCMSVRSIPYRM